MLQCFFSLRVRSSTRIQASGLVARTLGTSKWGSRNIRKSATQYIRTRTFLPVSLRGKHSKAVSLLDEPEVAEALRCFLREKRFEMDPFALRRYTQEKPAPVYLANHPELLNLTPQSEMLDVTRPHELLDGTRNRLR